LRNSVVVVAANREDLNAQSLYGRQRHDGGLIRIGARHQTEGVHCRNTPPKMIYVVGAQVVELVHVVVVGLNNRSVDGEGSAKANGNGVSRALPMDTLLIAAGFRLEHAVID
jgi:hypothetical protein